jgi:hypothetical protein
MIYILAEHFQQIACLILIIAYYGLSRLLAAKETTRRK